MGDKRAKKAKKAEKKAARQKEREASKSDKDDQKKALTKLGLQKMPSEGSLNKLTCVQKKIKELLVNCAKDILSKTNYTTEAKKMINERTSFSMSKMKY